MGGAAEHEFGACPVIGPVMVTVSMQARMSGMPRRRFW
jgi:hypothetical protein